jgi:hypothetical protein
MDGMVSTWVNGTETIPPDFRGVTLCMKEGGTKMKKSLQSHGWAQGQNPRGTLVRGMGWGLLGGLAGTLVMDLLLMVGLSLAGLPAFTCFTIVGNTAARFFSLLGMEMAGGALTGAVVHYLVGPIVGALFGALITQVKVLRADSLKKGILLAAGYIEILSQPILASAPILLKMTAQETWQWYSIAFGMHLILGIVLGVIVSQGLRPAGDTYSCQSRV